MAKLSQEKINSLRAELVALNKAYREGNPQISDVDYDHMVETLRVNSPEDEFFKKGIVEEATDRMEPLPVPMYSLEKIKTIKDFRKWLQKMFAAGCKEIVATPKFDGISLVVDEDDKRAWTRGDGVEGQLSTKHFDRMFNGEGEHPEPHLMHTWGEAIMKKKTFAHLKDSQADFAYKNARNMVAGIFNSPDGWNNRFMANVDFVRYGSDLTGDKSSVLEELKRTFHNVTPFVSFYIEEIMELDDEEMNLLLDEELHDRFDAEYKIDGVVIEVDEESVREQLGRLPNGNPAYAIAFKKEEWCDVYQTKVISIEKGVGKTGVLNPVIIIEPVEINGATVSRATAYNAAYLIDQHICEGAFIEVTRGGDVIPKHLKTIEYNENAYTDMMDDLVICPSCGEPLKWNETNVDLVCTNDKCKEMVISEMVYFFRTMGCEQFEEPTIRRLYNFGYRSVETILESHVAEFQKLLGKAKGKTVYDQIQKVLTEGVPMARYMTALNIFDGKIAEATCQKIFDAANPEMVERVKTVSYEIGSIAEATYLAKSLEQVNGVGEILARSFVKGLIKLQHIGIYPGVNITYVQTPKTAPLAENAMVVCMTGFRDKEMEVQLNKLGHRVVDGVTRECNVLVVADLNSNSSKMKKAKEKGLRIVTREDFENEIL